jgi:hypothetical protein
VNITPNADPYGSHQALLGSPEMVSKTPSRVQPVTHRHSQEAPPRYVGRVLRNDP